MRGLTDEERALLERWAAGVYEGQAEEQPSFDAACRLFERGLGEDIPMDGPLGFGLYASVTALGAVALRVDAAARAAGVWP